MVAATTEYSGPGQEEGQEPEGFVCEICERSFQTRAALLSHARTHAHKEGEAGETATRPGKASQRKPRQPKGLNEVQTGLLLSYSLAGQAFGIFGPDPEQARRATGMAIQMTALPAAFGLERLARRTPIYKVLKTVFGAAGALNDVAPLALPVVVGMYNYAPAPIRGKLAPTMRMMLGQLILQTYGPEEPAQPEDLVPTALPPWIQSLCSGLLPDPDAAEPVQEKAA